MATLIYGLGTGKAIAKRLISLEKPVILFARSEEKLRAVASEFPSALVTTVAVDASKPQDVEEATKKAIGQRPVSGFVYAVGSIPLVSTQRASAEDYQAAFNLNAVSGFLALKAATQALSAGPNPGSAVFFSTVAAGSGFPNHAAIAAAKGAVEGFVRSAAADLSPKIRVNAIAPSLTDTSLASKFLSSEAMRKKLGESHALPRVGTPDDLASLASFLLDDALSGWITGQVFAVDGGRSTVRKP